MLRLPYTVFHVTYVHVQAQDKRIEDEAVASKGEVIIVSDSQVCLINWVDYLCTVMILE